MPVSKEELAQYVSELGLSQDVQDRMINDLMANEKAATQFVGQRLRHSDYTTKTQKLADDRKALEANVNNQVGEYAKELAKAQGQINQIVKDYEQAQISAASANAKLQAVKQKFGLSDDDIPAVQSPKPNGDPKPVQNAQVDIEARLQDFQKKLMDQLLPQLAEVPRLTALQNDIALEHQELTGKRLTRADMDNIIKTAREQKISMQSAWETLHNIKDLRINKEVDTRVKKRMDEEDAKRKADASNAALSTARTNVESTPTLSPVLKHKFNQFSDPAQPAPADKSGTPSPSPKPAQPAERLTGAERAAARFIERRNQGIALGAPDPASK